MELLILIIFGALIAIPILSISAFVRSNRLSGEIDSLNKTIELLKADLTMLWKQVDTLQDKLKVQQIEAIQQAVGADTEEIPEVSSEETESEEYHEDAAPGEIPTPPEPEEEPFPDFVPESMLPPTPEEEETAFPEFTIPGPPPIEDKPAEPVETEPPPVPAYTEFSAPEVDELPETTAEEPQPTEPARPKKSLEENLIWWGSRTGIMLIVIGLVFFGVQLNRSFPSWVKLLELLAISTGISVLGHWLEGKYRRYGGLIFSGGLAMIYFCAFASYAVPALHVPGIGPATGFVLQLLAVGLITGCCLWKNSSLIATMGVFLGYISCYFSILHNLDYTTLPATLILGAGACLFYIFKYWTQPLFVAIPGTYLFYGLMMGMRWMPSGDPPTLPAGLGFLTAAIILFIGTDLTASQWARAMPWKLRRFTNFTNTALGLGLGYIFMKLFYPADLVLYYSAFGLLLLGAAGTYYYFDEDEGLFHNFFLKGSGLIALAIITHFEGPVQWMAVAVQSLGVLWTVRRTKTIWVEAAFVTLWLVSLILFLQDIPQISAPADEFWNAGKIIAHVYLVFSTGLLALQALWVQPLNESDRKSRLPLYALYALLIGGSSIYLASSVFSTSWTPLALALTGIVLMSVFLGLRHWLPLAAGSLPLIAAFPVFWTLDSTTMGSSTGILDGLTLIFLGVCIAEASRRWFIQDRKAAELIHVIFHGFAFITLTRLVTATASAGPHILTGTGIYFLVYLIFTVLMVSLQNRWSRDDHADGIFFHTQLNAVYALFVGAILIYISATLFAAPGYAGALALAGATLIILFLILGTWVPLVAGAMPFAAAYFNYWQLPPAMITGLNGTITGAGLILLCVLFAAMFLKKGPPWLRDSRAVDFALHVSGFVTLAILLVHHQTPSSYLAIMTAVSFATAIVAIRFPFKTLGDLSSLPVYLGIIGLFTKFSPVEIDTSLSAWYWAAGMVSLAYYLLYAGVADLRRQLQVYPYDGFHDRIHTAATAITILLCLVFALDFPWPLFGMGIAAILFTAIYRWLGSGPARIASYTFILLGNLGGYNELSSIPPNTLAESLFCFIALASLTAINPLVAGKNVPGNKAVLYWTHAVASLLLLYVTFVQESFGLLEYTTVFWGISAIAIFVIGLIAHLKPYRLTGLVGLALCVPRVFIVDIHDRVHRIIAFIVLGIVMLVIGYLYNRFKSRIEDNEQTPDNPPDS